MGIARLHEAHPLFHVVVVQEGHKVARGIAMRAEYVSFDGLAPLIHVADHRRGPKPLHHRFERVEKWIVERRIASHQLAPVVGVVADELGDVLLCLWIEDLAEGEEVFLADAEGKLAHGVAKEPWQITLQISQGVDAKPVYVVARDHVLVGPNQKALKIRVSREQLLERAEVPDRVVATRLRVSFPAKKLVLLDFARPYQRVPRRVGDVFDDGELWPGRASLIPPSHGLRTVVVGGL